MEGKPVQLDITTRQEGAATGVSVNGSLDALTAPNLANAFAQVTADGRVRVVADLAGLEYTSSAGLRVLLNASKECRHRGGELRIAAAQAAVFEVLDLGGFPSIIKIFDSVPGAVASFSN